MRTKDIIVGQDYAFTHARGAEVWKVRAVEKVRAKVVRSDTWRIWTVGERHPGVLVNVIDQETGDLVIHDEDLRTTKIGVAIRVLAFKGTRVVSTPGNPLLLFGVGRNFVAPWDIHKALKDAEAQERRDREARAKDRAHGAHDFARAVGSCWDGSVGVQTNSRTGEVTFLATPGLWPKLAAMIERYGVED